MSVFIRYTKVEFDEKVTARKKIANYSAVGVLSDGKKATAVVHFSFGFL